MDKEDVVYIHTMEYYSTIRKKKILSLVTARMDFESIILSETSQIKKDKYCIISIIYGI